MGKRPKAVMVEAMTVAAQTKHDLADLINVAIEELVKAKFELPAFSTLQRSAFQVRTAVTQGFYQQMLCCPEHRRLSEIESALYPGGDGNHAVESFETRTGQADAEPPECPGGTTPLVAGLADRYSSH
jgi:hypothetical protein